MRGDGVGKDAVVEQGDRRLREGVGCTPPRVLSTVLVVVDGVEGRSLQGRVRMRPVNSSEDAPYTPSSTLARAVDRHEGALWTD